jgi:hypothetical protein
MVSASDEKDVHAALAAPIALPSAHVSMSTDHATRRPARGFDIPTPAE